MMKMLLTILFTILTLNLKAPERRTIPIIEGEAVNMYDKLIKAIVKVESNNGKYLYNESEGAVGWFQIRKCRIDHFNLLTGSNYTLNDCYDYEISRKVFLFYTKDRSFELVAKSWNGSGPMTIEYWERVKMYL
jgi:hypothetical protein